MKGFGLTLLIGILASMFSALFVSKTIFGLLIDRYGLRKLGSLPLSFPQVEPVPAPQDRLDGQGEVLPGVQRPLRRGGDGVLLQGGGGTADVRRRVRVGHARCSSTTKAKMNDGEVRKRIEQFKEAIPQPTVVAVGDSGKDFSVVTANADRAEVSKAIVQAMGADLDVAVPSEFTQRGRDGGRGGEGRRHPCRCN